MQLIERELGVGEDTHEQIIKVVSEVTREQAEAILAGALGELALTPDVEGVEQLGEQRADGRDAEGVRTEQDDEQHDRPERELRDDGRRIEAGARALERGMFDAAVVRGMAESHVRGEADHSERLWSLINLELWHRIFLEGEEPAQLPAMELDSGQTKVLAGAA